MEYLNTFTQTSFWQTVQQPFLTLAVTIGILKISVFSVKLLSFLYRHTFKTAKDFNYEYNQGDSWAVVTGGSDGIGEQFCKDLAIKGFNICIVARNEEKMKQKLREIESYAALHGKSKKSIKTKYVVADLADSTRYADYQKIADQLGEIDIGMLFLNAGWTQMAPFNDLTPLEVEQTVTINALHPIYLTKALLGKLLARPKKSAIVVTSSGLGGAPVPGILAYSASKSFSSFLAEGLNMELKGKIDVLSFQCGEVKTKLLGTQRQGMTVITTERATGGCLRDVGSERLTYGAFMHETLMRLTPSFVIQKACNAASKKVIQRLREKQAKEGSG